MSKNVRGSEIGGAELSGGETLQCSRTLIVEDFAMGVRERERERERRMTGYCLIHKTGLTQ